MSDVSMYELEDIVWDEFVGGDDHIVPGDEKHDGSDMQKDGHKRLRCEVDGHSGPDHNKIASENGGQNKEERITFTLNEKEEIMLENNTWSHPSDVAFPNTSDGNSDTNISGSASDANQSRDHHLQNGNIESIGSLCADGSVLGGQDASLENSAYQYPLNVASTDNDISFFSNDDQGQQNSDLLFDGWPEIENFEDVDRMFRNCDSSFGVGIDNEDDLSWFSPSHAVESSDAAFQPDLKFLDPDTNALDSATEFYEGVRPIDSGQLENDADNKPKSDSWKANVQNSDSSGPLGGCTSFANGSEVTFTSGNPPKGQVHERWSKQQKSSAEQNKTSKENRNSHVHLDNDNQSGQSSLYDGSNQHSSFSSGTQFDPGVLTGHGKRVHDNCPQSQFTFILSDPGQVSACSAASGVKSEANGRISISHKESYGSNQFHTVASSCDTSFRAPTVRGEKKKKELGVSSGYPGHPHDAGRAGMQRTSYDPTFSKKRVPRIENEVEDQNDGYCSGSALEAEPDSSNVQESSCLNSGLDEVSLEASSFRQLQHVMEKLDIRTKLCIRDSLYRLARSAEQKHKCGDVTSGGGDSKDGTGALTSDETKKCTGFMDMETDTNPIDRSIAHLLFHRPSVPSAASGRDPISVKSRAKVHASDNGPFTKTERLASRRMALDVADERSC